MDQLSTEEMELFWMQCWLIWNQHNCILYGGQLKNPASLNKRVEEFLQDFKQAQVHLIVSPMEQPSGEVWQPPPSMVYKLNFDATIFLGMGKSGIGVIREAKLWLVCMLLGRRLKKVRKLNFWCVKDLLTYNFSFHNLAPELRIFG